MIEFTLSRVCVGICGLILLGAVFVPAMHMFENGEEDRMDDICENIAGMIERFIRSDAQELTISLRDILPSSYTLSFEGNVMYLEKEDRRRLASLSEVVEGKGFNSGDTLFLRKGDVIEASRMPGPVIVGYRDQSDRCEYA